MNATVIVGLVCLGLFFVAFMTKRRYGVLGLALAAGVIVSSFWAADLLSVVQGAGMTTSVLPLDVIVTTGLILLPACLLLFSGPTYTKSHGRFFGALLFALLALTFVIQALGPLLILKGWEQQFYDFIVVHRTVIVTIGIAAAVLDLLLTRTPRERLDKSKH